MNVLAHLYNETVHSVWVHVGVGTTVINETPYAIDSDQSDLHLMPVNMKSDSAIFKFCSKLHIYANCNAQ